MADHATWCTCEFCAKALRARAEAAEAEAARLTVERRKDQERDQRNSDRAVELAQEHEALRVRCVAAEAQRDAEEARADALADTLEATLNGLEATKAQRDALVVALRRIAEMSELGLDGSIYRDIHTAARAALAGVRHGG